MGDGKTLWPDPREMEIIEKINRVHKWYSPGTIILVPDDMNGKIYMDYSPFPNTLRALQDTINEERLTKNKKTTENTWNFIKGIHHEKVVIWNPELLAWAAYDEKGKLVNWGPGLGGADSCEGKVGSCRTPSGIFEALQQKGVGHRSDLYPTGCKGAECSWMPYAVKVREDGLSMHGSKWFIGRHASHGCVRLFTADAKWLNKKFFDYKTKDKKGTTIIFLPYPKNK
ncbi:MAG: L,D-transpeptidase [Patescibacteria group bacterium]